jgi:outer membrane receptor protein involved in Fe transport
MFAKFTRHLLFMALLPALIWAGTTGKIAGRIVDAASGEPLIGANIMVEGTNLGASTDMDGYYFVVNVPPGRYTLVIQYVGYADAVVENLLVQVDRTTQQDLELSNVVITSETVLVEATRPAIEIDRTHSASVVNSEVFDQMPVTELAEIIELQAGVVNDNGQLHFRGGRSREVSYLVDGIPVNNNFSQSGGANIAVENAMVAELEVISGTFNAEYGAAQSGVVNIVTRNIASEFSGNVQMFAGEWLSNQTDVYLGVDDFNPLNEKDVQFSLNGPLLGNSVGIFVSGRVNNYQSLNWYERRYNPADGWQIAAYERWYQRHNTEEFEQTQGIFIPDSLKTGDGSRGPLFTGTNSSLTAKLMFRPSGEVNISYQFFGNLDEYQGGGADRRYQPDETARGENIGYSHFVTFKHAPTPEIFYDVAFSYQYNTSDSWYRKDNYVAQFPGDFGIQPIGSNTDGFSLGNTAGFYTGADGKNFREQLYFKGSFNWQINRHNLFKAGFEFRDNRINTYSWGYRETQIWQNFKWADDEYADPSVLEWDTYWLRMQQHWRDFETIYGPRYERVDESEYTLWRDYTIGPQEFAAYVQDKIELGDIIINAGLRFDAFRPNEKYPIETRTESFNLGSPGNLAEATNKYQLSPRIGISFPISERGAIHASYGHFFQMPAYQYMYNEPLFVLNKFQLEDRYLGNANLDAEKTINYEIGLQQGLTSDIAINITAYYKDFRNLLGVERITTIDAVGYFRYVNRDYGNTRGITLGLSKNTGFVTGGLNYTLSFANGSSSDPNTLYLIETATRVGGDAVQFPDRQIQALDWDQRHTLNSFINVGQPGDWTIGFVGWLNSGQPYSPQFLERFDITEREYLNSGEKPLNWSVDLKGQKFFAIAGVGLMAFLQIDNLFDNLNEVDVFNTSGRANQNTRLPEDEALERERLTQEGHFTLSEVDSRPNYYSSPRLIRLGIDIRF